MPSVLYTPEVEHGAPAAHFHRPLLGLKLDIWLCSGGRVRQVDPEASLTTGSSWDG